jgi:molybdenum cofactor cytidylyltransferase
MKTFDAILLTAGKSSRMGRDKALLEINNRKIINIIIEKLINSINNNVYIVLGYHSELIKKNIEPKFLNKIKIIYNENYEQGMYSSIKKGVFALSGKKHFILQMIDQPFIGHDLYNKIIEKYDGESPLLQPVFNNKKGHPIIINKKLINLIKNDTSNSLRDFLSPYYKDIQLIEYNKDTILQNLNDYESFNKALVNN